MRIKNICTLIFSLIVVSGIANAENIITSGHSHNDYEHSRPLWDALENGFVSIEADIHLSGQKLLVGHDPEDLKVDRTLQSLYLDPLRDYILAHNGWVYPGKELILMIDIKTAGDITYKMLKNVLTSYSDILTTYTDERIERKAVAVIISGNRPCQLMIEEKTRYCTYDGRLTDLNSKMFPNFMILISDNWQRHFQWRGEGPIPAAEYEKLLQILKSAHAKNYRIRFWSLPGNNMSELKEVWRTLLLAGVDLLSIDDLQAYHQFIETEHHN